MKSIFKHWTEYQMEIMEVICNLQLDYTCIPVSDLQDKHWYIQSLPPQSLPGKSSTLLFLYSPRLYFDYCTIIIINNSKRERK